MMSPLNFGYRAAARQTREEAAKAAAFNKLAARTGCDVVFQNYESRVTRVVKTKCPGIGEAWTRDMFEPDLPHNPTLVFHDTVKLIPGSLASVRAPPPSTAAQRYR